VNSLSLESNSYSTGMEVPCLQNSKDGGKMRLWSVSCTRFQLLPWHSMPLYEPATFGLIIWIWRK